MVEDGGDGCGGGRRRWMGWLMEEAFVGMVVGVKTGGSRVGVPNCASKANGNRRQGTRCFTQVQALSMDVIPYFLLD